MITSLVYWAHDITQPKFIKIEQFLNQFFFESLEYHLTRALRNMTETQYRYLWCDGIAMPHQHLLAISTLSVNKTIKTKAWLGTTGQDVYQMTIKFGADSIARMIANKSLTENLPDPETPSTWIKLDIDARNIELQLQ